MLVNESHEHLPKQHANVFSIKDRFDRVIAWTISFKAGKSMFRNDLGYYINKDFQTIVYLYTKKSERDKGYGSKLAKAVRNHYDCSVIGATFCSTIFKRFDLG